MNYINQFLQRKLTTLQELIRESNSQNYLNINLVSILYIGTRFSLLFLVNQFCEKDYEDDKLSLVKNIINWVHFLTPIESINNSDLRIFVLICLLIYHWVAVLILFVGPQLAFCQQFGKFYYTYFQVLILYPSYIHIHSSSYANVNRSIIVLTIVPILFNYFIFTYLQRMYTLPVTNPYIRRYKLTNYLIMIADAIGLTAIPYLSETYQCVIIMILFLAQTLESIIGQPYSYIVNIRYCICSSVIFFGSVLKQLGCYLYNQEEFFYFSLLIIPLLSAITEKYLILQYEQAFSLHKISKDLIIQIVDEYHQRNEIIQNLIIYQLRSRYKIKNTVTFNKIICMLFAELIDQRNPSERYLDEDLYIYKILFIQRTNENPNLGQIKMRKFQAYSVRQSFYFKILEQRFSNNLEKKSYQSNNLSGKIQLGDIRKSEKLQELCLPLSSQILEIKLRYWEQLLAGYSEIEAFSEQSIKLSQAIHHLKQIIFQELKIHLTGLSKELIRLNILDLRLLSFLFGAILNDYHITLEIEQSIEDLVSFERNLQTKNIINTSLLNDDVIIASISMIKNPGQILSQNRLRLQRFFQFPNENAFLQIQHISQLLPAYLKENHTKFMNKFLISGESELFSNCRDIFPIFFSGFSFNATLQLMHFPDLQNDYVVAAALKKSIDNNDFIIFDPSGKIIGLTESAQKLLLSEDIQEMKKILLRSYIFFWFQDLLEQINQQYDQTTNSQLEVGSIDTTIIQPITNLENVVFEHDTFRKQNLLTQTNTIKTDQLQDTQYQKQLQQNIPCFERNYVAQTLEFVNCWLKEQKNKFCYQVQYRLLLHKFANHPPIFLLAILDFQQKGQQKSGQSLSAQSTYRQALPESFSQLAENTFDLEELNEQFVVNQSVVNKLFNNNQNSFLLNVMKKNNDSSNAIENQKSIDYREGNLISPRSNRDVLIAQHDIVEDDEDDLKGKESNFEQSSSQKEIKEDIAQIIQREQNAEVHQQQQVNKSKSSGTSDKTQNSIYNLIRKLSYTEQYQSSILKAVCITNILAILLLILVVIELYLYRLNTDELEYNIPLVRVPQRFNRLFCTFVTLGQLDLQNKLLNQSYGEYYDYRIKNESTSKRIEIEGLMIDIKNNFALLESQGNLPLIQIRIINQYVYELQNVTMIEFDSMVNEYIDQINQYFQISSNDIENLHAIQVLVQFLKGNLLSQLDFTITVVQEIEDQFFWLIDSYQTEYFVFLVILLMIVFVLLIIQFKQWQQPYKYMQQVLLLIAKISEKDIDSSCLRLYVLIEKINRDSLQWKHFNYYREFFGQARTTTQSRKPNSNYLSSDSSQVNKKNQRAKQTSRIQETSFSIRNIWIILVLLWILLSAFVLSAFLVMKINIDNSKPELTLTMEYVKFKQDLDGIMIICQLLKNQQILIDDTMASGIFSRNPELSTKDKYFKTLYSELLSKFAPLANEIAFIYSNIYNDVVASSKLSDSNKELLLNLYQNDLCEIIPDQLPFCSYIDGHFTYFPTFPQAPSLQNNKLVYKYGINGIYQEITNIFSSHFSLELNGIKDSNLTSVEEFLQSADYVQVVLPYFFDLSYAILEFYYTILQATLDMLEADFMTILIYYLVCGIGCIAILYVTIFVRAITLQRRVKFIRQTLIVIPHESLQDQSILNVIRKIDRSL